MRQIKFRGRRVDTGEFVYGDLIQFKTALLPAVHYFILHNGCQDEVEPDSVAQLVGRDVNGKEVYEGDIVIRYDSEEEFIEAPENGVLREVVLYTQVNPDLESYYCFLKEAKS